MERAVYTEIRPIPAFGNINTSANRSSDTSFILFLDPYSITGSVLWKASVFYSGSLLLVVLSHSKLSSLWVGDARGVPGGCTRSPWKRLHSGQMRMWLQPRATMAASCASLWDSGSDNPVPAHNLPLLRLVPVGRVRLLSVGRGCERRALVPPLRLLRSCRLSWHSTMPCSSRSISSHTDNWEAYTHGEREREREARETHWYTAARVITRQLLGNPVSKNIHKSLYWLSLHNHFVLWNYLSTASTTSLCTGPFAFMYSAVTLYRLICIVYIAKSYLNLICSIFQTLNINILAQAHTP